MIIASSVYVITDIIFLGNIVPFVNGFLEWMTMHTVLAVIACIFFFAAATLVFVPHAILTCGAGWAFSNVLGFGFGLIIGLFVSFMGSALGAVLSFIRSRYMMRDLVELFAERFPIVKAVDRALERKGFKVSKRATGEEARLEYMDYADGLFLYSPLRFTLDHVIAEAVSHYSIQRA